MLRHTFSGLRRPQSRVLQAESQIEPHKQTTLTNLYQGNILTLMCWCTTQGSTLWPVLDKQDSEEGCLVRVVGVVVHVSYPNIPGGSLITSLWLIPIHNWPQWWKLEGGHICWHFLFPTLAGWLVDSNKKECSPSVPPWDQPDDAGEKPDLLVKDGGLSHRGSWKQLLWGSCSPTDLPMCIWQHIFDYNVWFPHSPKLPLGLDLLLKVHKVMFLDAIYAPMRKQSGPSVKLIDWLTLGLIWSGDNWLVRHTSFLGSRLTKEMASAHTIRCSLNWLGRGGTLY